jgi:homocysteine S-methyltransferase
MNEGQDWAGNSIGMQAQFFVGCAVNPVADDLELELDRFRRKVEAGAKFAITQVLFDLDFFDRFTERLGGSWPIPVLIEIFPATSHRLAARLHNEVPGIFVPEAFQEQLRDAGAEAAALGFERARELIAGARERAAGVCLMAPFRRPLRVLELLE